MLPDVTAPDPRLGVARSRLARYEARTDGPLLALSVCFIVVYSMQVAAPGLPAGIRSLVATASWVIWGVFALDLVVRVWLAERRGRYLVTHPVDVLVVLLPALRPLRVLRVFTAGQALVTRGGRISLLRSTRAIAVAAGVLVLIAALAALDAEREAEGTHITTLADSLWWAATTVTTVGYGDTFPVTGTGRMVAVALMLVGISLVGVITATVAAWFIAQTRDAAEVENADLSERLTRIEATLAEILTSVQSSKDRRSPVERRVRATFEAALGWCDMARRETCGDRTVAEGQTWPALSRLDGDTRLPIRWPRLGRPRCRSRRERVSQVRPVTTAPSRKGRRAVVMAARGSREDGAVRRSTL